MKPSSRLNEAREVANQLLNCMEMQDLPVDRYLLQAKRLARLLRDSDAQTWLDLESRGYPNNFIFSSLGNCLHYVHASGRITDESKYYLTSLPRLEAECATDKHRVENTTPKASTGTAENYLVAGATTKMYQDQIAALNTIKSSYLKNIALFAGLKAAIHSYATDTLISLEFGDVAESIFDQLRYDVDTFVRSRSPKAAEKLVAISERMAEGNPEACAEALTSCRRLLMTIADSVSPPSEIDWTDRSGKKRKVGAGDYKNRLIAFIESKIVSDGTRSLLENDLEHLCSRLDAIYDKSCKGVHAEITFEESRLTIVQAYIFIGEVARVDTREDQQGDRGVREKEGEAE
ncbi:MAG: hypothetical protein K9M54_00065 [Kiritimatiellales bacterium]|nr:hypothetical protein [Kiritimatiellales bacterium]